MLVFGFVFVVRTTNGSTVMFHPRDYIHPHNYAAHVRGMMNDVLGTIQRQQEQINALPVSCSCSCSCSCSGSSNGTKPTDETGSFLIGVSQGSSMTIGTDGVFIARKQPTEIYDHDDNNNDKHPTATDTTVTANATTTATASSSRILAAWATDGLTVERIDDLGKVPDPQSNGTMSVA
jgi:hypothetical protein